MNCLDSNCESCNPESYCEEHDLYYRNHCEDCLHENDQQNKGTSMRVKCTLPQDVLDDYEMDLTEGEVYEVISTHSDCIFVVGNTGIQECLEEDDWTEV